MTGHDSLGRCLRCGATITTGGCSRCDSVTVTRLVGVVHPDGRTTEVDPVDSCLSCAALRAEVERLTREWDAAVADAARNLARAEQAERDLAAAREALRAVVRADESSGTYLSLAGRALKNAATIARAALVGQP